MSRRRRRHLNENPSGVKLWHRVALAAVIGIVIFRGPQIFRGIKGLVQKPLAPPPPSSPSSPPSSPAR